MSGGVDSSVAACLLREQGYDVVGVFMRLGADEPVESHPAAAKSDHRSADLALPMFGSAGRRSRDRHRGCCSAADSADARAVTGRLGIPFYALNFAEEFSRLKRYFSDEYARARTPNPCVVCNQWLKFGKLLDYADAVEADWIATGHYARLDSVHGRPRLRRARDLAKDQSYVLFGVPLGTLRRTLFPLGELTKGQVRAIARRNGLAVHDKPDSQDICFVADRRYADVVKAFRPDAFSGGTIRHVDGRRLGAHPGLAHFTVGQRRGLGVAVGTPVYVSRLDAQTNTVFVGPSEAVESFSASASNVQWLVDAPRRPLRAEVRIRYNHVAAPGEVVPVSQGAVRVWFDEPQWAVTPGQAMVFYRGDEVLGGGWID